MSMRTTTLTACVLVALSATPGAQETHAFYDAPVILADHFHRIDRLLDLDGDGDQDAVGWWWLPQASLEQAAVTGWINDGDGRLVERWSFTIDVPAGNGGAPQDLVAGRIDGDLRDDFAVSLGGHVWLYTGNGAAWPEHVTTLAHGTPIESLALADYDGDGDDDLALNDGGLAIYRNLGRGAGRARVL